MYFKKRAGSILQDWFAQLMLQKDVHPTKCFWQIQEQKTTQRLSNTKILSLTQESSEIQIRWNQERNSEKTLLFSGGYTVYSSSSICHKACLGSGCWAEWSTVGLAVPVLMSPLFMQSLVADFTCICHALIQDFTCFEPDRIFLSDRSTIPNEMCLEGVLWPRNIGKLKFLSIVNLSRTLLNSENSF